MGGVKFFWTLSWCVESHDKVISARELEVENTPLLYAGNRGIMERKEIGRVSAPETTYNFEVADYHTYLSGRAWCIRA